MTKHTVIIFLSVLIVVVAIGGFPAWARTTILVLSGIGIAVLAYLSSVVYCSNCKKLILDAEQALPKTDALSEGSSAAPPQNI
ncbi:MAG: hypothetical protein HZB11_03040 [Candidatus Yonathbacteria bacterium]|nr:hypothetical protein [Candidatus Yonathbacteria bacterium]